MMVKRKLFMRLSKSHRAYFEAARSVAQLSDFPRISIGCVAVYKHRVISSGFNSIKTDTLQKNTISTDSKKKQNIVSMQSWHVLSL